MTPIAHAVHMEGSLDASFAEAMEGSLDASFAEAPNLANAVGCRRPQRPT
jgi:hypothetical protein